MKSWPKQLLMLALNHAPLWLFAAVLLVFTTLSPQFLTATNLSNILVQSSATAIVAIGMTLVLITAGVDLSVGALMFVAAAIAAKTVPAGAPLGASLGIMLLAGLAYGAFNAFLITKLRLIAFVATLATLFLGRGFALWLTETRETPLPPGFLDLGAGRWLAVPVPIWVLAFMLAATHLLLTRTPFGRQVYAVGQDLQAARKAGVNTDRILAAVYVLCGFCAAVGSILALAQLGSLSPTFGTHKEFSAIAAAVLGGTSLFGGRGRVFPGTLLGAVLVQTVENGLVILNANPYLYPLITSAIIFLAVLIDSTRTRLLAKWNRRHIRPEDSPATAP